MGRSWPGSRINPTDASPPGSLSLQICGSVLNTSYGGSTPPTGDSSDPPGSLPIDPYLNCSVMSPYSTGRSVRIAATAHTAATISTTTTMRTAVLINRQIMVTL